MGYAHNRFTCSCHTGSASTGRNVSAGTVITKANWRKYKDCFSDGIQAFWQGAYFWKISEDVEIHVGNPHTSTLPKPFIEASEKYDGQTRLVKVRRPLKA